MGILVPRTIIVPFVNSLVYLTYEKLLKNIIPSISTVLRRIVKRRKEHSDISGHVGYFLYDVDGLHLIKVGNISDPVLINCRNMLGRRSRMLPLNFRIIQIELQ